ncbi:MAG TPA: VOC family protein [Acidimicrobiia bacterium]
MTPRMVVRDVEDAVAFLRAVFDGTGEVHPGRPAEIRIGDSLVMVSAAGPRALFPAFLYVYVDDADRVYERALGAGAVSLEDPPRHPLRRSAGDGAGPLRQRVPDRPPRRRGRVGVLR